MFGGETGEPGLTLVGPPRLVVPELVAVPLVNERAAGVATLIRACSTLLLVRMMFDVEVGKSRSADALDIEAKRKANPEMQQRS